MIDIKEYEIEKREYLIDKFIENYRVEFEEYFKDTPHDSRYQYEEDYWATTHPHYWIFVSQEYNSE